MKLKTKYYGFATNCGMQR